MNGHDTAIAVVLGTRPEIIKLAHIIRRLGPTARVVHTGQHYDPALSGVFFHAFGLADPTVSLEIGGQSRGAQIGQAVSSLDDHFEADPPKAVVVQGDTNTTMAAAIAANAREIPIVHVEAGLRSHDRAMPEEHNRIVTDHLADLLLAPTDQARTNLLSEGIADERIVVTGNTVVEAVTSLLPSEEQRKELLHRFGLSPNNFILSTFHRPENVDSPETFAAILGELAGLAFRSYCLYIPALDAGLNSMACRVFLPRSWLLTPLGTRTFSVCWRSAPLQLPTRGVSRRRCPS